MENYERALRRAGCRVTEPRRAVAQVVARSDSWLRPEEIHRRGQDLYPRLGLVTVYRTLSLFEQMGFVRRIHLEDGCHGYASAELSHGHHLVCRSCQQVVEFGGLEGLPTQLDRLARRTGFVIEDHMLELLGLCPQCQQREG